MEQKKVYPIRLADKTIQALAALALKRGRRAGELAREAIEKYVKREEKK